MKEKPKYVGRGGLKMEGALAAFGIVPEGWTCLDVGTNQLAYQLRTDPRVIVKEQFNARGLEVPKLGEKVRRIVMDLSFISLTKILPAAFGVLEDGGSIVCLIKPQFELAREDIGKGGIVREPTLHDRELEIEP